MCAWDSTSCEPNFGWAAYGMPEVMGAAPAAEEKEHAYLQFLM